jgi:hypothetical protein
MLASFDAVSVRKDFEAFDAAVDVLDGDSFLRQAFMGLLMLFCERMPLLVFEWKLTISVECENPVTPAVSLDFYSVR